MELQPGLRATAEKTVTAANTALALGSGDVEVFGTPAVVALCEEAAVQALAGALDPGSTSVGTHIDVTHTAPTPPGGVVSATAVLESVEGRKLVFAVEASDPAGPIASGRHTRMVVDRERFARAAAERSS